MGARAKAATAGIALTPREREVLVELCRPILEHASFTEPAATRTIAKALFVTEAAVKQHLLRLYDKFAVPEDGNRRCLLANAAFEQGIIGDRELGPDQPAAAPAAGDGVDALRLGRAAAARRDWAAACVHLAAADAAGLLDDAGDLAALGEAALWTGRHAESITARQRAHGRYLETGDIDGAAIMAAELFINFIVRSKFAVGGGWLAKGRRLLEDRPEGRAHGRVAAMEALGLLAQGRLDEGAACAAAATRIGASSGDRDSYVLGQAFTACVLARTGHTAEAMALFDEAMASATSGELGTLATGVVYCRTLCTCLDQLDYRRASEWTEVIDEASGRGAVGLPGDCRAHRAAALAAMGDWPRAEAEARSACAEAEHFDFGHVGLALCELGQLRLRGGDADGAEESFRRAESLGAMTQPGMSLVRLARGEVAAAAASIASALQGSPPDPLSRARLLPARIEIALAAEDHAAARGAAGELATIADFLAGNDAVAAAAAHAAGAVALVDGAHGEALGQLRRAVRLYLAANIPYEAAAARHDLGLALAAASDPASAADELRTAEESFARLGAVGRAQSSSARRAALAR